jgi:hypothetical protein
VVTGSGTRSSARRNGHGRTSWTVKDPGHSQETIAAPKKSWRQQRQRGAGMRKQRGGADGSPRVSPNFLCLPEGKRETGQAPCYAVERMVSPVRVHSPVRYIPAPRIGRAKVGIEPGAMKPALRIWSPVRLLGPAYMAPALRMVSPLRQHSPVRAIPPRRTGKATGSIQPSKVGQARCSRASRLSVAAGVSRLSGATESPACPALPESPACPALPESQSRGARAPQSRGARASAPQS